MKTRHAVLAAILLSLTTAAPGAAVAQSAPIAASAEAVGPTAYRIDPTHAQARITWNHMGLSRPGATFETIEGLEPNSAVVIVMCAISCKPCESQS